MKRPVDMFRRSLKIGFGSQPILDVAVTGQFRTMDDAPDRPLNIRYEQKTPETLSAHESFCKREEEISISSSTWKVAILSPDLLDDLELLIVRQAAR